MVNQIILNYLKANKDKYPLKDLKEKVISSGYSKEDVDEAERFLDKKGGEVVGVGNGKKWIKFGAWCGVFILVFSVLNFILSFFGFSPLASLGMAGVIISIILVFALVISILFFLFGFIKLGKYTGSKLLRFSAKVLFGLVIAYIILIIIAIIWIVSSSGVNMTGNAISDLGSLSTNIGLIVIVLLVSLFLIVVVYMFFISLIKIRKQIRFAKSAGILGLIVITLSILLSIIMMIAVITNPFLMVAFMLNPTNLTLISIANIVASLVVFGVLLLECLVLFDGSKKFEN
tara:strand:+ start:102 stop:965 length:864 start_codon:yes stop_codon:yes gene_type:complete